MKKILSIAIALGACLITIAQVSQMGINYQCQVRNNAGVLVADSTIKLRFSLLPGQFSSQPTWQEEHNLSTDHYGIASAVIGQGTRTGGTVNTFNLVDFSSADYWIKVEIFSGSGFVSLGASEPFQSVPYAKVAGNASPFPAGFIMPFAGDTTKIPSGWLLCDGREVSRASYATLYGIIADNWGRGNNSTTFNLPDLRGMFLRGVSYNSTVDPDSASSVDSGADGKRFSKYTGGNVGNSVGSYQKDKYKDHVHSLSKASGVGTLNTVAAGNAAIISNDNGCGLSNSGGSETRPMNAYVNYLIKY